jgi:alanyl-tRNA synthetase
VVKVDQDISTELCGGTHVTNTKDIGCFALLSQEAVASGIKRISAVVGPKVYDQILERDQVLHQIAEKLNV